MNKENSNKENPNKENPIVDKSFVFAVRIVKFVKWLEQDKVNYKLTDQVLRSGTSIGANVAEAQSTHTKKDFLHKMHIAFKEANETIYWLRLLQDAELVSQEVIVSLLQDAQELRRMLSAITKTTKENIL